MEKRLLRRHWLFVIGTAQMAVASSLWFVHHLCASSTERVRVDRPLVLPSDGLQEKLGVSDIAFGILTSDRYVDTRLHAQQRTWIRLVRHVVFYSEHSVKPTTMVEPASHEKLVGTGAWKDLPALKDMYQRFATRWFFLADDDAYVFVSNLVALLDRKYAGPGDHYVG